jgi:hypothetical protein
MSEESTTTNESKTVQSSNKIADEAAEAAGKTVERPNLVREETFAIVADEDAAPPLPKVPKMGVYVLEQGDTPGLVSNKIYGRSHKAVELARANMNSDWQAGDVIQLV